jgi:dihydrofolate synthase/folylpolyglutamate synthase
VITPLALEHTAVLGDTIEEIAFEKAGIIKPGVPIVTAVQKPEALEVLRRAAEERHAPFAVVGNQSALRHRSVSMFEQRFDLKTTSAFYDDLHLRLLGRHQQSNALLAVTALEAIRGKLPWRESDLRTGLATVEWHARVEVLSRKPCIIVDGAHTVESANALLNTLTEVFDGTLPRTTLIVGVSMDKNSGRLILALGDLARDVIFTQSQHPRAMPAQELAAQVGMDGTARVTNSVAEALDLALEGAEHDGLIVATGSLFVAAEAREQVLSRGYTLDHDGD